MRGWPGALRCLVVCLMVLVSGCEGERDARTMWREVVRKCVQNDLLGRKVLYFGASNTYGPGTIWATTSGRGYFPVWKLDRYVSHREEVVNLGSPFSCVGTYTSSSKFDPLLLLSAVTDSAGLSADFQKAEKVAASVSSIRQDDLEAGPFELAIRALDPQHPVVQTLWSGDSLVMTRAFLVRELSGDLEFSHEVALQLRAKYKAKINPDPGAFEVSLDAQWKSDTTLHVVSSTDFYIGGELRPYISLGRGSGPVFGPALNLDHAKVTPLDPAAK